VLQAVAKAIENEVRDEDCFGRYGGEEFILILRSRNTFDPGVFAERIRHCVAELRLADVPTLEKITVSIGVAQFNRGEGFAGTISRADSALYLAKESGRNRVVFAERSEENDRNP
jgi:diguanylate cyclase (GGDEF)-like protein